MLRCILAGRPAVADEVRPATSPSVLASCRAVLKDRNEDTAYLTAWKRIQDKLAAPADGRHLHFKSNPAQRVSHVGQWQDIVSEAHADPDLLRHLGLKDTVECIWQAWTMGAKFYGSAESFVRTLSWLRLACRPPDREATLNDWWLHAKRETPKAMRKGLATITHLTAWLLWKHRNSCVFDDEQPSMTLLSARIREEAALWVRAGAVGLGVVLPITSDVH
ncbi:hypothetical protein D1007_58951 [Hordeum vulgare]|nr:hypothetical protein D1007_58951 [Hordeum vulgare]